MRVKSAEVPKAHQKLEKQQAASPAVIHDTPLPELLVSEIEAEDAERFVGR